MRVFSRRIWQAKGRRGTGVGRLTGRGSGIMGARPSFHGPEVDRRRPRGRSTCALRGSDRTQSWFALTQRSIDTHPEASAHRPGAGSFPPRGIFPWPRPDVAAMESTVDRTQRRDATNQEPGDAPWERRALAPRRDFSPRRVPSGSSVEDVQPPRSPRMRLSAEPRRKQASHVSVGGLCDGR